MNAKFARLLALLLAVVMVVSMTACSGNGGGGGNGDYEIEPLEGEVPEDLGGYEFTVVDGSNSRWNRELSGTPYADAWVQILDEVETLYNCKISATYTSAFDIFTTVQPEIAAGGKYADLIITTQWAVGQFMGANLFMDLNELDVDWSNEWWNKEVLNATTYGGKTYVGGGSFIFDTSCSWLLYYNEAIWNELGFEDPYKLVDEGRWTYDVFRDYCMRANEDRDGSGVVDSIDDRWGLVAADGDFTRAWYLSMGGSYFKTNEETGKVSLACNNSQAYDIIEKMRTMVKDDGSVSDVGVSGGGGNNGEGSIADRFVSGNALFWAYVPGQTALKDMEDDWGVMPLPKYNEAQADYYTGVDHNSSVFGIANTNEDIHEVSVMLEALGRHAMILEDIFWPDYKETFWRHEEKDTAVVANYVVGHARYDIAPIMQKTDSIFMAPMDRIYTTVYGNSPDFSSWIDMVEDTITEGLEDYFKGDTGAMA